MATSFTAQSTYTRQSPKTVRKRELCQRRADDQHGHRAGQVADVVDHLAHDCRDAQRAEIET